jgi:AcrR family transcriptional regulator
MADPRLHSIYLAAGRLFNTKRYANTKVAEIAEAAGVATGTIYNLFTSKKAILTFVIHVSLEKGYLEGDILLPIEEADKNLLMELFMKMQDRIINHVLQITDANGNINRGFVQMISDMFDFHADTLLATGNIEQNANLMRELAEAFFLVRDQFLHKVEENLKRYMDSGEIRQLEYPHVHVQSITDVLTWWSMNSYITMEISVPRDIAKKTAVDLLSHAYLKKFE